MDEQTELLKGFKRLNTKAIGENKKEIDRLQQNITEIQNENLILKEATAEQARYKRRWNFRLNGLPEKEEDTRDIVIGILTKVVPMSMERLCGSKDTTSPGKKGLAATSNNTTRSIIVQFANRIVRDEVWKRSKDARVYKEMHIQFKQDFSREDQDAHNKLIPEARKRGQRALLKEGYEGVPERGLINNRRDYLLPILLSFIKC